MKNKIIVSIALILGVIVVGTYTVKANPSFFPVTVQTATATTSPLFIPSGGTATSTLVLDSYSSGNPRAASQATLLMQLAASTTPGTATLRINIQYSQDNVDWYDTVLNTVGGYSTTTRTFDIGTINQISYPFSSTTADLGAGFSATSTRAISVQTPTRYVRAVFTSPPGATSLSYWAQWVPLKETQ
jgi:hypothetical protein